MREWNHWRTQLGSLSRQFFAAATAVGGGIALWCGIAMDIPEAIQAAVQYGPAWLQHPDFLWFVFVVIAVSVLLRWIYSGPDSESLLSSLFDDAAKFSPKAARIALIYCEVHRLAYAVSKIPQSKLNREWIDGQIQVVLPQAIESAAGEESRRRFNAIVGRARRTTKDHSLILQTISHFLEELLEDAMSMAETVPPVGQSA